MSDSKQVLEVVFDVPIECSFRRQGTMNQLPTYPVPPLTTLRGVIYSAFARPSLLNQESHHYRHIDKEEFESEYNYRKQFEENTRIGIIVEDRGLIDTDLRTRQKKTRSETDEKAFLTYVAEEETILSPTYRVFISSDDQSLLQDISDALEKPERPLYLGRSDDIVDVKVEGIKSSSYIESQTEFDSVIVPESPNESFLLPIEMETVSRSANPAKLQLVGFGGSVDSYYQTEDGKEFVFID